MEESIPDYSEESLKQHDTVRSIVDRCTAATRQWINDEVSRDYLVKLTGLAGTCISLARDSGLEGHHVNKPEASREADMLLAQLVEMRELLRYPRYAAATLASDKSLVDSAETRRKLVDQHIDSEPGHDMPSP